MKGRINRRTSISVSYSPLQLESSERSLREMEACESARIAQMAVDLEDGKNRMGAMREALVELDDQCERLMVLTIVRGMTFIF